MLQAGGPGSPMQIARKPHVFATTKSNRRIRIDPEVSEKSSTVEIGERGVERHHETKEGGQAGARRAGVVTAGDADEDEV